LQFEALFSTKNKKIRVYFVQQKILYKNGWKKIFWILKPLLLFKLNNFKFSKQVLNLFSCLFSLKLKLKLKKGPDSFVENFQGYMAV